MSPLQMIVSDMRDAQKQLDRLTWLDVSSRKAKDWSASLRADLARGYAVQRGELERCGDMLTAISPANDERGRAA